MHRAEGRRTTLVAHRSGWWDRVVLLVMVATAVGRGLGARGAAVQETSWETRWNGSQAAWVEDDDAEVALDLLEQALALRPPPDAENKMLEQLVPILEGVKDESRVLSALETVHATLIARHGMGSRAAVAVAASLASAKASLNDVHGALKHAQEVVDVVLRSLQELEHSEAVQLEEHSVALLEQTLTRMTNLYAQHARLDLAANTAARALEVALKIHGPQHLKVAELRRSRAELLLEIGEDSLRAEALELLLAARQVLVLHLQVARDERASNRPPPTNREREKAADINASLRSTLESLVVCHRDANDSEGALEYLRERRELPGSAEQDAEVERNIGAILARAGSLEEASTHYKTALELINSTDWRRRASILESLGNIAFLEHNFSGAVELRVLAKVATSMVLQGKLFTSAQELEEFAAHDRFIASVYIRMGKLAEARTHLLEALQTLLQCHTHQCITERLLALLIKLKSQHTPPRTTTQASSQQASLRVHASSTSTETKGGGGGSSSGSSSSSNTEASSHTSKHGESKRALLLDSTQVVVAKTLLTIALLDTKLGMVHDALTHARRARDLLIFAPHSSGADREKAQELVVTLEASSDKNTHVQES